MRRSLGISLVLLFAFASPAAAWTSEGDTLALSAYGVYWTDLAYDGVGGIQANVHHQLTHNSFQRPVSWYRLTTQGDNVASGNMAPAERACPDGSGGTFAAYAYTPSPYDQGGIWLYHQKSDALWDAAYGSYNGLHLLAPDAQNPANVLDYDVVSDGAGGVYLLGALATNERILVWHYVDGAPAPGWTADGIVVQESDDAGAFDIAAIPDGAGGVLIALWSAGPGSSMIACRMHPDGTLAWTRKLTPLAAVAGGPLAGVFRSGDSFYACWQDVMSASPQIRLHTVAVSNGFFIPGWPSGGALIASSSVDSSRVRLVSDEANGAYVAWSRGPDVRAVRMTSGGTIATGWPAAGVPLTDAAAQPALVSDPRAETLGPSYAGQFEVAASSAGLVACWGDLRFGVPSIRARWLLANGTVDPAQPDTGRYVCPSPAGIDGIMSDGQNGAYVAWAAWHSYDDIHWMVSWLPYTNPWLGVPDPGPSAPLMAIHAWPNPARDVVQLEFAPLVGEAARLELVDVTGHRVRTLDVSERGARSARFERLGSLPSGVYFARMVRGGTTQGVRVALVH